MILPVHTRLRDHLTRVIATLYSLEPGVPACRSRWTTRRTGISGTSATPAAFELARRLRKAPRAIAQEIAAAFGTLAGIRQVTAAPNGYLNFFLERPAFLLDRLGAGVISAAARRRQGDRRAHGHQPEQGRSHRASPEFGAR